MATNTQMSSIGIRLPVDLVKKLKEVAELDERSLSFVVRKALEAWIAQQPKLKK